MHHLRPNRLDAFKQGATGFVLIAGVCVCFCSGVSIVAFTMGGVFRGTYTREPITNKITDAGTMNWVPLASVFLCLGLAMILGAFAFAMFSSATERQGRRKLQPAKVIARYAVSREGYMLVAEWEIEAADRPRYYVRLDFGPQQGTMELECLQPVFYQCGEGMTGLAETQGKWIGAFRPNTGAAYQSEHIFVQDNRPARDVPD